MIRRKRTSHNDNGHDGDDSKYSRWNGQSNYQEKTHSIQNRLRYHGNTAPPTIIIIVVIVLTVVTVMIAISLLSFKSKLLLHNNNNGNLMVSTESRHDDNNVMDSKLRRNDNGRNFMHRKLSNYNHKNDRCKTQNKTYPIQEELIDPFHLFSGEAIRFGIRKKDTLCNDNDNKNVVLKTVEIVIAYCQEDLDWIHKDVINVIASSPHFLGDANTTTTTTTSNNDHNSATNRSKIKLTIMSKCGKESLLPDFVAQDSRIDEMSLVLLPNVGGCDYAYAHFINQYIMKKRIDSSADDGKGIGSNDEHTSSTTTTTTSVILFIKGSMRSPENFHFPHHERYRRVDEMLDLAIHGEFGCGIKTTCDVSPYHDTSTLNRFTIKAYSRISDLQQQQQHVHVQEEGMNALGYKNLHDFHHRALNWTFPNPELTLVCYGGTFAISAERIVSFARGNHNQEHIGVLRKLEKALSRANTKVAVEEHFAERTWAGILAEPLSLEHTKIVKSYQTSIVKRRFSIFGPLQSNKFSCDT